MGTVVGHIAGEIDRLVIAGHAAAARADDPPVLATTAQRGLLNSVAVVLLNESLDRSDVGRIVPYLPAPLADALIEDNVSHDIVQLHGDRLALTERGEMLARAVVEVQEKAIAAMWAGAGDALRDLEPLAAAVVARGRDLTPPALPDAFRLFARAVDRPSAPARVLRLITAMRYWRADAHRAALAAAGLEPQEAHALNRLWDAQRGVERVGQGRDDPGKRGVAALEGRGLAASGTITAEGLTLREAVEQDTDRRSEPLYDGLDRAARHSLLHGLQALPS